MGRNNKKKAKNGDTNGGDHKTDKENSNSKMVYKFALMTSDKSVKYATFEEVKEKLTNFVQKEYDFGRDVAWTLREMEMKDIDAEIPVQKESKLFDKTAKGKQNATFKSIFDCELKEHVARKRHFRNNLSAIYALITDEYCTEAMLSYIEQRSDFKTTIRDDPLELLKAIEEGIHQPAAGQFHLETLSAAYWRWLGDRQQKQETVDEYLTRHKHFANLVEAHMCEGFMHEFQKTTHRGGYLEYSHCIVGRFSHLIVGPGSQVFERATIKFSVLSCHFK